MVFFDLLHIIEIKFIFKANSSEMYFTGLTFLPVCTLFRIMYWESVSNLVEPGGIVVSTFSYKPFELYPMTPSSRVGFFPNACTSIICKLA